MHGLYMPTTLITDATFVAKANEMARCSRSSPPAATLSALRQYLLEEALGRVRDQKLRSWFYHAAVEAEALAWLTPFPLLFLPDLFDEKVDGVRNYVKRQAVVGRTLAYSLPSSLTCRRVVLSSRA